MPIKAGDSKDETNTDKAEVVAEPAAPAAPVAIQQFPASVGAAVGAAVAALMSTAPAAPAGPPTLCRCLAPHSMRPGEQLTRWGHSWVCDEDGQTLSAMIPEYDVANGVAAGRWRAEGMPQEEAQLLFLRRQYSEVKGVQAPREWTLAQVRGAVNGILQARGAKESPDFVKSE